MELKEITKKLIANKKTLCIAAFIGLLLGFLLNVLPHNYSIEGSFFVKRTAEAPNTQVFTYEGYYSQQTALAYTNSVIALLESTDLLKETLTNLQIPVTETTLRKFSKNIDVKKAGPQVITLTVKDKNPTSGQALWNEMANVLNKTTNDVNAKGDPNLSVSKILDQPVVKEPYNPLALYLLGGLCFGLLLGAFYITLKEYSK